MDSITFGWHYFIPHDIIEIAEVVDRAWLKEIFMLFMSLRCRILAKLTERENEQDKEGHALLSTPTKHRHILRPTIYLYLIRGLTCMIKPYSFAHLTIPNNTFSCFSPYDMLVWVIGCVCHIFNWLSKLGVFFFYKSKHWWPSKSILHESLTEKETILGTTLSGFYWSLLNFLFRQ